MNSKIIWLCFITVSSGIQLAKADDLENQQKALNTISNFAEKLCKYPPLAGNESKYELSGEAKAELSKVLKKVADLGVKGAAKYQASDYEGLLQKDLANVVKDSSNCKMEVWRDLKDRLIPPAKLSEEVKIYNMRIKSFPLRPDQISGVTLDIYIDNKSKGKIGNIPNPKTFDMGQFKEGLHSFRFENINAYYIDRFGTYSSVPNMNGLECEGDFGLTTSKTFQLVVWYDGSGNLTCDLR